MNSSNCFKSPIGTLYITGSQKGISEVRWFDEAHHKFINKCVESADNVSPCVLECVLQLEQYFLGKQKEFYSLALAMHGTDFQQRVWDALLTIPFGETVTYSELARFIGHKDSARAVGNALNQNPLQIIVPCHRVVPSTGGVGDYAAGRDRKEWLLRHEGHSF